MIHFENSRLRAAVGSLALAGGFLLTTTTSSALAAEPASEGRGWLEIKRIASNGRVTVETIGPQADEPAVAKTPTPAKPKPAVAGKVEQAVAISPTPAKIAPEKLAPAKSGLENIKPEKPVAEFKAKAPVSPFVEDEPRTTAEPNPAAPVKSLAGGSSKFQPKFRSPAIPQTQAIQQVQHLEPLAAPAEPADDAKEETEPKGSLLPTPDNGDEPDGPQLQPIPAANETPSPALPVPTAAGGRGLIDQAFAKSKEDKPDYAAVIDLCRQGLKEGVKPSFEQYARQLMGWAYNRRGEALAQQGKAKEALADFEAAVECNPTGWRAMHNRAVSHASLGRVPQALADFDRTIELKPDYPNAWYNRGELQYSLGKFADAIRDYTQALKIGPPDAGIYNSRGHAFYRIERFGDALRDYSEAIRLEPANAAALINRGDTHSDLGQYFEAAADYREAVKANPKMGRAYQSAAWLMATCPDDHYRNAKLAIEAAEKAIELGGAEDYHALETLAAAQANAGQFTEAKQTQEQAIALTPRGELVAAEKRLGLYQRDVAFREPARTGFAKPEDQSEQEVRQASAEEPVRRPQPRPQNRPQRRPNPRYR